MEPRQQRGSDRGVGQELTQGHATCAVRAGRQPPEAESIRQSAIGSFVVVAPHIDCDVSQSVWSAIQERVEKTGADLSDVVDDALSEAFDLNRHSIFQVSTSNALVKGVFGGVTTVGELKRHGDFGLGTFSRLDGELVMLDGECFRATAGGSIGLAEDEMGVPFAVVTRFHTDIAETMAAATLSSLADTVDGLRPSNNLFVGIRVDGVFTDLMLRAACPALPGEGLVEATRHQSEFSSSQVTGSLVGFWSPPYARTVNIPGFHFHFISSDRTFGGHVLDLRTGEIELSLHVESDLHLAIPETEEFLAADLSGEHQSALHQAETARHSS